MLGSGFAYIRADSKKKGARISARLPLVYGAAEGVQLIKPVYMPLRPSG